MSDTPKGLNQLNRVLLQTLMSKNAANIVADRLEELERENARLQMELDASCNAEELRQVRAQNAALRADKERMDWCDKNLSGLTLLGKSMREYVDAARKEQS